jgi:hypothetical protein
MQHDLQSHQQDRLHRILLCLHGYIGSSKWLAMQNLQIQLGLYQSGFFHPASQTKIGLPRGRGPNFVLVTPIAATTQKQQNNVGGWVLRSGGGQLRGTGSTSAAPPATSRATNPRQHRPKDLSKTRRDIHLVEIKYCEDTRPQNQLNAAKEQHKDLCNIFQGASVTLHIILLGVGGTIYNTSEAFQGTGS